MPNLRQSIGGQRTARKIKPGVQIFTRRLRNRCLSFVMVYWNGTAALRKFHVFGTDLAALIFHGKEGDQRTNRWHLRDDLPA